MQPALQVCSHLGIPILCMVKKIVTGRSRSAGRNLWRTCGGRGSTCTGGSFTAFDAGLLTEV